MKLRLGIVLLVGLTLSASAAVPGANELADVILTMDENGDDTLDEAEFREGTARGLDDIDRDGDGEITPAEVDTLGALVGNEQGSMAGALVPPMIKVLLATMDKDANKLVSREEYRAGAQRIFALLDKDKNAILTRAELTDIPAQLVKAAVK